MSEMTCRKGVFEPGEKILTMVAQKNGAEPILIRRSDEIAH